MKDEEYNAEIVARGAAALRAAIQHFEITPWTGDTVSEDDPQGIFEWMASLVLRAQSYVSADDVRVEEITCYRGFCPRCTWYTMDFLDHDSPRRAVEYHLKMIHNDGRADDPTPVEKILPSTQTARNVVTHNDG